MEWTIDDPPCLVCRGEPARSGLRDSADVTPVYLAGGSPAVPTGLVFARFRQGVGPRSRAVELAAAGFEVRDVPGYAPNAAWLAHVSGRIEDALLHLPGLREVQDIEAFEPQLVMPAGRR